jgi:hypothetical protein
LTYLSPLGVLIQGKRAKPAKVLPYRRFRGSKKPRNPFSPLPTVFLRGPDVRSLYFGKLAVARYLNGP